MESNQPIVLEGREIGERILYIYNTCLNELNRENTDPIFSNFFNDLAYTAQNTPNTNFNAICKQALDSYNKGKTFLYVTEQQKFKEIVKNLEQVKKIAPLSSANSNEVIQAEIEREMNSITPETSEGELSEKLEKLVKFQSKISPTNVKLQNIVAKFLFSIINNQVLKAIEQKEEALQTKKIVHKELHRDSAFPKHKSKLTNTIKAILKVGLTKYPQFSDLKLDKLVTSSTFTSPNLPINKTFFTKGGATITKSPLVTSKSIKLNQKEENAFKTEENSLKIDKNAEFVDNSLNFHPTKHHPVQGNGNTLDFLMHELKALEQLVEKGIIKTEHLVENTIIKVDPPALTPKAAQLEPKKSEDLILPPHK